MMDWFHAIINFSEPDICVVDIFSLFSLCDDHSKVNRKICVMKDSMKGAESEILGIPVCI